MPARETGNVSPNLRVTKTNVNASHGVQTAATSLPVQGIKASGSGKVNHKKTIPNLSAELMDQLTMTTNLNVLPYCRNMLTMSKPSHGIRPSQSWPLVRTMTPFDYIVLTKMKSSPYLSCEPTLRPSGQLPSSRHVQLLPLTILIRPCVSYLVPTICRL